MVTLQILNKVLSQNDYSLIQNNGLDERYFPDYVEEFIFIKDHYKKYLKVPDKETFIVKFPEFSFIDVQEPDDYLLDTLSEEFLYTNTASVIRASADLLRENSNTAVEYLLSQMPTLNNQRRQASFDIMQSALARLDDFRKLRDNKDTTVIRTGMPELDALIYGWLPGEELITIVGRTNQGKSWLLLQFLCAAWKQGKRVGLYSGEMSYSRIGYRIDTLLHHFSNFGLLTGTGIIEAQYEEYLKDLMKKEVPLKVVTPADLDNRPTVTKLQAFVEKERLDILGVDQLSLMTDERAQRGDPLRIQMTHVAKDLFDLSCRYKIPIIAAAQANREASKRNRDDGGGSTPELEDVSESDGISQNCSKVLTMRQAGPGLEISIKKNRDGRVGGKLTYYWDIDRGEFKYVPTSDDALKGSQVEKVKQNFKDKGHVF